MDNHFISDLVRILRRETADHPLMLDAIEAKSYLLDGIDWNRPEHITQASSQFADVIEDWVGYRGEPLGHYIREPWLSGWRKTCCNALLEAHATSGIKLLPEPFSDSV